MFEHRFIFAKGLKIKVCHDRPDNIARPVLQITVPVVYGFRIFKRPFSLFQGNKVKLLFQLLADFHRTYYFVTVIYFPAVLIYPQTDDMQVFPFDIGMFDNDTGLVSVTEFFHIDLSNFR
jgi:hypothetical protein